MSEMKDSGIEWIGDVPQNWQLVRIKVCVSRRDSGAWGEEATGEPGDCVCIRVADMDYDRLRLKDDLPFTYRNYEEKVIESLKLADGDILIEKSGGGEKTLVGRAVMFRGTLQAVFANFMERIRCRDFVRSRFLLYILAVLYQSGYIKNYIKQTTGIQNLDISSMFSKEYLALPPVVVQERITDFLDRKCSQIDAIIARQQEVIEKLKAYKLSKINEIIVEVEGITAHLGYVANMKNGLNFNVVPDGKTLKFLGVGDFKDHYVLNSEEMFSDILVDGEIDSDYMLQSGDIIFVRSNGSKELVGRAVMVENVTFPLSYSGFCIRFRNLRTDILNSKYLLYFFRSPYFRKQLEKYSQGSNITNINQALLSQISIIIPPVEVQLEAIRKVEKILAAIDKLITGKQEIVSALERYKKSLIYEVVTGKKEV